MIGSVPEIVNTRRLDKIPPKQPQLPRKSPV
jgi:hypothetical protein